MNEPKTDFVLVYKPRANENELAELGIVRNNGKFDFSEYSFLKMYSESIEEWVPTAELGLYKNNME